MKFSPSGSRLAVGSWNGSVYLYARVDGEPNFVGQHHSECTGPVLDLCWGRDDDKIFAVGLGCDVIQIDFETNMARVLGTFNEPSNKIAYSAKHDILISTSWEGIMQVLDFGSDSLIRVKLAQKPYAISLTDTHAVIAMAERKVSVYDLQALKTLVLQADVPVDDQTVHEIQPWQERESSMKFITRDVACLLDGTGFATSSIEGRVSVEWFDPEAQNKTYAFKCHRSPLKWKDDEGNEKDADVIFPVNALVFHPVHGTFATGGGDGVVAIWDAQTKRRVKQYHKLDDSIAAMDFSPDGRYLAIGICPGFVGGEEEEETDPDRVKLFIRELAENEAKGKEPKAKAKADQ